VTLQFIDDLLARSSRPLWFESMNLARLLWTSALVMAVGIFNLSFGLTALGLDTAVEVTSDIAQRAIGK